MNEYIYAQNMKTIEIAGIYIIFDLSTMYV